MSVNGKICNTYNLHNIVTIVPRRNVTKEINNKSIEQTKVFYC